MNKIVIVGGVAGGMSAATRLRRLNENAQIIVFEKGPYVSFANCGLPYYVSNEIRAKDDLLLQTPETLKARFNLDVRPFHEVIKIDSENKNVTVKNDQGEFIESYDTLILAPGAKPFIPPIQGIEMAKNVFSLRNVPDLDKIMHYTQINNPKSAIVIGAGFIGLEMAENLAKKGLDVTIIEKAPHVLPPLDQEMAAYVQHELVKNNIKVITNQSAVAFNNEGQEVVLENGEVLNSDLIILSVGVTPENTLAKEAGIKLGLKGGILVDENYQTNLKDIYAVGDAIVVKQQITNDDALISLASPANRQGRQVADVISGYQRKNKGSIGTAIVRVFDLVATSTGLSERQVKQAKLEHQIIHLSGNDHAGYYPNATEIVLKLIFNPTTGLIYGASALGQKGVDKRIDILATAIKGQLTIYDLVELELSYAPPFGSAKDLINLVGYAAMNLAEGISENIQWYELNDQLKAGKILLDVREPEELKAFGQFKNALNIPLNSLRDDLIALDKSKEYIISCRSGLRSYIGERILKQNGFKVKNLDGAFALYSMVLEEEIVHV